MTTLESLEVRVALNIKSGDLDIIQGLLRNASDQTRVVAFRKRLLGIISEIIEAQSQAERKAKYGRSSQV